MQIKIVHPNPCRLQLKFIKDIIPAGKKLVKINKPWGTRDANLTGVCEGIGEYLKVNPWYVRMGFVGLTFWMPWTSILGYLGLALLLPGKGSQRAPFNQWTSQQSPMGLSDERTSTEEFVVCDVCGTAVETGSRFCHHCGNRL